MDTLRGLGERGHSDAGTSPLEDWVSTGTRDFSVPNGSVTRFGEGHQRKPAKSNVSAPPMHDSPENPALRTAWINYQIQAIAVSMATSGPQLPNSHRGKRLLGMPPFWFHSPPNLKPLNPSHKLSRMERDGNGPE
jgi:hypothetical protein